MGPRHCWCPGKVPARGGARGTALVLASGAPPSRGAKIPVIVWAGASIVALGSPAVGIVTLAGQNL